MIELRIVPKPEGGMVYPILNREPTTDGLQAGDMWRDPEMDTTEREAWGIVLPNRTVWYTTSRAGRGPKHPMWEVTGEPPRITVKPSIWDQDPARPWHGWITEGRMEPG